MTPVTAQDHEKADRIAAVDARSTLGTLPEERFDFLARLAADVCRTGMAAITFLDSGRQVCRSVVGTTPFEINPEEPFHRRTMASPGPFVVEDALADASFGASPLVTGAPRIRFYAGAPLSTPDGEVLGTLSVMDTQPHTIDPHLLTVLEGIASQVTALVEQRRDARELALVRRRLEHDERLAHVAAWEWIADSDEATWTPELRRLLGVGAEVPGSFETFLSLVHEEDVERVRQIVNDTFEAGGRFSYRARIVRPDGEERIIDAEGAVRLDETGEPVGMWGATVDVTELVESERRGREQAQGLRAAFDTALDPILVSNTQRELIHVNRAACRLLGYRDDELLGMRIEELIASPAPRAAVSIWETFVESGQQRGEIELRRSDGSTLLVEFSATADFVPGRHLTMLRDVTERRTAEQDALETRQRLEETQALALVGSWEWDLASELQVMSVELMRILGRGDSSRQPTYEEFLTYIHPDDRDAFVAVVEAALQTGQPYTQEFRVTTEAGAVRTIESHGRVELNKAGEPVRMVGAAQDITDRKRVEYELRLQANVLDQVPAGIVASGADRRITQWSIGAEVLFGIRRADAIGQRFDDLGLIPSESEDERAAMTERLAGGKTWEGEIRLAGRGGRSFLALVTNSPIHNAAGVIEGYVGVIMDLTEREDIEREVGLQGYLLDQVGTSVFSIDLDRRVTHWNRGAETLFGWTREEAVGRLVRELGLVAGDPAEYRKAVADQEKHGGSWELELDLAHKDGTIFPAVATSSTVRDLDGTPRGYVGISVDLTERKLAEQEASAARLETIKRLAMAVEKRDPETGGHIERIGEIAAIIAERLGIDSERIALIRASSPMHDVGKVGIADAILLKPGKLTDAERGVMEMHSPIGHDILAGADADLDLAATIALTHHERVDGTGYPNGLKGDEIPVEGRIVAVADVFDALTSDRVYRKAFSVEKAIEIMEEGRGTQFDPEILDALLGNLDSVVGVPRHTAAD